MTAYLSLIVALVGLFLYLITINPKLMEVGRIAFFCGLFAFLLQLAPRVVGVLGR